MINTLRIYDELKETMESSAARKISEIITWIYEDLQNTVTKKEFNELTSAVRELAAAQKQTELKVEELAVAQARTEQRVEELAAAQARTEQRVEELAAAQARTEQKVEELAAAQARTEQRVEELAAAQARTEQKVEELAAAQARTEQKVELLADAQLKTEKQLKNLAQQVGALSEKLGGSLEDLSYDVLPACLEKYYQIEVDGLAREFFRVNGKEIEVNVFGKGLEKTTGKRLVIIGEVKTNITLKEVKDFIRVLKLLQKSFDEEIFPLLFGFRIRLDARELAKANQIRMFVSYGKEIK
jgi:DNA repair exonuclease SbcCD ATPase subunit